MAVFVPSLVLAWLAVRSLRDQQLILERQQSLLYQGVADTLARQADDFLARTTTRIWPAGRGPAGRRATRRPFAAQFDEPFADQLAGRRSRFCGHVERRHAHARHPSRARGTALFYADFGKFLGNRESAQVYCNQRHQKPRTTIRASNICQHLNNSPVPTISFGRNRRRQEQNCANQGTATRNVVPQQQALLSQPENDCSNIPRSRPAEAEFRQLVGDSSEGMVARFWKTSSTCCSGTVRCATPI